MRNKLSIITVLFLSLCWQQATWAATQIQASVSNNPILLGDRFTLTITINDTDSSFQLDTTPLNKDFRVSRPSRSNSNTYINGKSSAQTTWQISLQAKHLGDLLIPGLKIGNLTTQPITMSVLKPSNQATKTQNNEVFMENSLDKKQAYVGQPIILTSKIFISRNSDDLSLDSPTLNTATVSVYGDDQSGETVRNGIRYKIITRQFKILPNQAGTFTIQSPVLNGSIRRSVRVDDWRNRIVSDPINIRGDSLQVKIKAKPENYQGTWLVSDDVRLSEDKKITQTSYHVGEPITRTITLQIASIDKDKLPNLDFNYPKSLRFYPDQDELTDGIINNLHYAQRTIRHAIIADQPGKLTLPEIKLAWWNSKTDKQEYAILPAQTLTILPSEKTATQTPDNKVIPATSQINQPPVGQTTAGDRQLIIWQIISATLCVLLFIVIFYHLYYRHSFAKIKNKDTTQTKPVEQTYARLQAAFAQQQAAPVYQALLNYAHDEFPTLKSLSCLPKHMHLNNPDKTALSSAIKSLEEACAHPTSPWNAQPISGLIKKYHQQKSNKKRRNIMEINPR